MNIKHKKQLAHFAEQKKKVNQLAITKVTPSS